MGSDDGRRSLEGFREPVRAWFVRTFGEPTRAQALGWPAIRSGQSTLLLAPTGSGKTLAAFLSAIDGVLFDPPPPVLERCRVLYVSPLKALAVDIEKNLRAPVAGILAQAQAMGWTAHEPAVAIRTGDTPSAERARFLKRPADILITTPESLYLLLTSSARAVLRSVRSVIVDEIHAMVGTKRGTHLALSLERLEELTGSPLQRIGLSATQRPLEEVARFLGGFEEAGPVEEPGVRTVEEGLDVVLEHAPAPARGRRERPVRIVDAGARKRLDLRVESALADLVDAGAVASKAGGATAADRRGVWPAIHPLLLDLIGKHRSTLIFVNSRRLAERLAASLNELAGSEVVHAHHGSIAREQRLQIEGALKAGRLPALVATSSLELGIDMGAIDLVIQVEAPPGVASAMQRIGRAGHRIDDASKGVIIPRYRADLLACAAITERMHAGAVEPMRYPRCPLDVLAQQIVAMVAVEDWTVEALERVVRRAAPYADLPRSILEGVLDMLSGRYPSDRFAELRPRVTWDRDTGRLTAREGARRIAIGNAGSIPDRGLYGVFLHGAPPGKGRVGELDEEMVFESRVGDVFTLGASSWRIVKITYDRVVVAPAPGAPGRMPFWHGETIGRPLEFGRAIGELTRNLLEASEDEAVERLTSKHGLSAAAARDLLRYLEDQVRATGAAPDDRTIVVERHRDEMGDWRTCILSPFGARVHAPWAMAIALSLRDRTGVEPDVLYSDDGIVVRQPDVDTPPPADLLLPDPDEVESLVVRQLGSGTGARQEQQGAPATALYASRFREAAARALLLPRRRPGKRSPLWQQRKRAADLLGATAQFGSFPIILEAYRECLRDVFDLPALTDLLRDIQARRIRVVVADTHAPSPFAASLLFHYVANFMYEGDAPLAERRAQALTVDPVRLRELLGDAGLRDLLDPGAVAEVEAQLQCLTEDRRCRHADALHDMLLRLGDLTAEEIARRCDPPESAAGWLDALGRARRVIALTLAGEERHVAVEDAARYRDGVGAALPDGLPAALLTGEPDALTELVARYARTHGPFHDAEAARRWGVGVAPVADALRRLEEAGRVLRGEFRPGGSGVEWCHADVLRALRRRSLAVLRREVEPVEQAALARLLLEWHGLGPAARPMSPPALLDVVHQLQGADLPASALEGDLLAARLKGYDSRELDLLLASGQVVWVGAGATAPRDGRVRLYLRDEMAALFVPMPRRPEGPLADAIRQRLHERGPSFFSQIVAATGGGFAPEVLEALWELVWAGEVTNDTLQPLRARLSPHRDRRLREARARGDRVLGRYRPLAGRGGLAPARPEPADAAGRWWLVETALGGAPPATDRLAAWAAQLLDRHAVLTRDAAVSEEVEGGFSGLYPVLTAMEDAGRVRRGYFVEGLGASQFAAPEVVDRLRALREPADPPACVLLGAADPANPYGAALPWPERNDGRRPARVPGALVALAEGHLGAWVSRDGRALLTFPDALGEIPFRAVAGALADAVRSGARRAWLFEEIDGGAPGDAAVAADLLAAGFASTGRGLLLRG